MANYAKTNIGNEGRVELHEKLSLTGAEISINQLPAGASVPFVHSHKNNEEIYGILSGKGKAVIDNGTIELTAGDWLRISPAAKRQFFASQESDIPMSASRLRKILSVVSPLMMRCCTKLYCTILIQWGQVKSHFNVIKIRH